MVRWAVVLGMLLAAAVEGVAAGSTHVVVPCYNEVERLPRAEFLAYASDPANANVFFTFVNDGSKDGTLGVLKILAAAHPKNLFVLDLAKNGGKAEAVRQGINHVMTAHSLSEADYVAFWDADLATPLGTIKPFAAKLDEQPRLEMVFGARVALLGRDIQRDPSRHYLGRIFATLASLVLDLAIYDTQCGAKMFRVTPDLRAALSAPFTSGWIFDVELIARFKTLKAPPRETPRCEAVIYEFPLEQWYDVAGSKLSFSSKLQALYGLASIWWEYCSPVAAWTPPARSEL